MTTFTDGPAAGTVLELRRAPKFLRVVRDADGTVDALDQLNDTPKPSETILAYRLVKHLGTVHLNRRDRHGRHTGGTLQFATYALIVPQPDDSDMRLNARWQMWAMEQMRATPIPQHG